MKISSFAVTRRVVIVRQYKGIGITSGMEGWLIAEAKPLASRWYNGRVAFQHGRVRVGLTTLRQQPPVRVVIEVVDEPLPF